MRLCDHVIYSVKISSTKTTIDRDLWSEHTHTTVAKDHIETVEIMAPEYGAGEQLVRAYVLDQWQYRNSTDIKILEITKRPAPTAWIQVAL